MARKRYTAEEIIGHLRTILSSPPLALVAQTLAVDTLAGVWDLGYVPWILQKIGVQSFGGKF